MLIKNTKFWFHLAAGLYLLDAAYCLLLNRDAPQSYMLSFLAGLLFLVLAELAAIRHEKRSQESDLQPAQEDALATSAISKEQNTTNPKY